MCQSLERDAFLGLGAIERCLKLDDLDGQWCVPADLAKSHVGHFNDQLGITGDLGAELTAVDAVCELSLRGILSSPM